MTWVVTKGEGSVVELSATTDADGISAALWTLGDRSGLNELRVSTLDDAFLTFQALGEAFRVDRLSSGFGMGCGLVTGAVWCWGENFWAGTPPVKAPCARIKKRWIAAHQVIADGRLATHSGRRSASSSCATIIGCAVRSINPLSATDSFSESYKRAGVRNERPPCHSQLQPAR